MFCAPGLFSGGTEGVGSCFHVLRSWIHFRRCRVRRVPFSCFVCPDLFSAVPRVSDPVFMISAPDHVFGGAEGVGSHFHVLHVRTHFRRNRGSRLSFSCFAFLDSFSAVRRVSYTVFMFCVLEIIFGGTKGIGSRFDVWQSRVLFWQYKGRQVSISCFALPDSFSAVPRASVPVFLFCAFGLIFGGTEGVSSRFHILRSWTRFRRY
jgi:hypothetical protein